jgi:hypothetical protein
MHRCATAPLRFDRAAHGVLLEQFSLRQVPVWPHAAIAESPIHEKSLPSTSSRRLYL